MAFPGTMSLRAETCIDLMREVCRSVIQHGFRKVVLVNGHDGNLAALDVVISELRFETKAHLYLVEFWEIAANAIEKSCGYPVFHADETETTLALALNQRVEMALAADAIPKSESSFVKCDLYAAPPKVCGAP
jgi:creatinine amidohydrolase